MTTFVLIHGAYQGGWIWKRVAAELVRAGARVLAPTLDGCAERKDQVRPGITTETHAAEIAELLFYEDLTDVVLVGTSTGGMVMAAAAERARERVARLVFADALALLDGEALPDIVKRPTAVNTELTSGPSRQDFETRLFADLDPGDATLGDRALHAASDRRHAGTGPARALLGSAVERVGDLVHAQLQSAAGASAPHRRSPEGALAPARHRSLSDAHRTGGPGEIDRARLRAALGRLTKRDSSCIVEPPRPKYWSQGSNRSCKLRVNGRRWRGRWIDGVSA